MSDPILHKAFKYTTAAESAKPGYLKAKFDRIRRELREKAEAEKRKPIAKVAQLNRGKA